MCTLVNSNNDTAHRLFVNVPINSGRHLTKIFLTICWLITVTLSYFSKSTLVPYDMADKGCIHLTGLDTIFLAFTHGLFDPQ